STQPKVLKQKLILSKKRSLPNGDANPQLMDFNDPAKYLNTEPAWYAIMVVQHNSLSEFVGPGKNNTLSMKYLDEHIDEIYPHGYYCTSKTAIANDKDTINQVVHKVVDIEDDSNDYYVAGDKNLEWIMYAEIAADVILTVVTMGGGAFISGSLKGIRATKTGLRLTKNMNKLKKFRNVEKYIKSTEQIENINRYQKILKDFEKAQKSGKDVSKLEKELQETFKMINRADKNITEVALKDPDKAADILKVLNKNIDDVTDVSKQLKEQRNLLNEARKKADPHKIKDYDNALKEIETLRDAQTNGTTISRIKDPAKKAQAVEKYNEQQKRIEELEKILKDYENSSSLGDYPKLKNEVDNLESVEKYIKQSEELEGILKYHNSLNAFRRPQTGNIITRNLKKIGAGIKSIRAAKDGAKAMTKAGNVARAGMSSKSAKIKSWLMDNTLKHGARLGMATNKIGEVYGLVTVAKFLGDMYDQTSNTSSEFSNGIEFKPFCLLSADDLEGQENVVNYGMWLMWVGNSTDENDDDAAYLQAMDFASKFYYQLDEFQDENTPNCNVDIYVV
nr:hypothetical protein [Candidatus Enterousia merdequi]